MSGERDKDVLPWRGDWRARIEERLRGIGHGDFAAFLEANPGLSYGELAQVIGLTGDVAPVQLERLHVEVAGHDSASRKKAILDSLARFLRGALKKGWGSGRYWESSATGALASWTVMWGGTDELRRVKETLFAMPPPIGWTPQPKDDPVLRQAYERALSA